MNLIYYICILGYITVPDLKEKLENQLSTMLDRIPLLLREDFTSNLELKLRWDPLPRSPGGSVTNLKLTVYDESMCNQQSSIKLYKPDLNVRKLSWMDVYGKYTALCFFPLFKHREL